MESLLANYASSDDDDEQQQPPHQNSSQTHPFASNRSTPAPQISHAFSSLPKPKSNHGVSSIPLPNPPKRVVQFEPPMNPSLSISKLSDDDDEEEQRRRKPIKESTQLSGKSLFSILPAPKNSMGLGYGAALGSGGGRSMVVVEDDAAVGEVGGSQFGERVSDEGGGGLGSSRVFAGNWGDGSSVAASEGVDSGGDSANWVGSNDGYYGNYERSYGYGHYEGSAAGAAVAAPVIGEADGSVVGGGGGESFPRMPGKRGRDEIPLEIVEVKQDELMKNRPREDQVKSTGIAFGPAYQPVSTKGKPSKLHKRKHQIGSLYYDMKQRESELTERRSKGLLTKAETQAKYGW